VTVLALVLLAAMPALPAVDRASESEAPGQQLFAPFDVTEDRAALRPLPEVDELSKKELWLADKSRRLDVHMTDRDLNRERRENFARRPSIDPRGSELAAEESQREAPAGTRIAPLTTLFNLHTREALPLVPGQAVTSRFHEFLRDYTTNQATHMDARLIGVLERVALRFSPGRIEVVSGYRSPKYNLMLRKKGREVAKSSQHSEGNAVDFRIRGVPTRRLLNFVKSLRVGGVGYYPHSEFVHSDTGRIRFWKGT
jgi:hypothetical protein